MPQKDSCLAVQKCIPRKFFDRSKYEAFIAKVTVWALNVARDGKKLLAYFGDSSELDLSDEYRTFRVNKVKTSRGQIAAGEIIRAGENMTLLSSRVFSLNKE